MHDMIVIDGAQGEGGGQVLRSALALSLVTGRPFRIERVRAGRKRPGLMRQHLTAVDAARRIGSAVAVVPAAGGTVEVRFADAGDAGGEGDSAPHAVHGGAAGG
jgi:RNA 3'-terminal phosphate cyclase (ATP)